MKTVSSRDLTHIMFHCSSVVVGLARDLTHIMFHCSSVVVGLTRPVASGYLCGEGGH